MSRSGQATDAVSCGVWRLEYPIRLPRKPATSSRKSEVRSQKSEVRSQKHGCSLIPSQASRYNLRAGSDASNGRMEGEMSNVDSVREQVLPDARQPPLNERRLAAWIGKALLVQGKIVSTENLTIDGSVEGTIELGGHSLTIGPGASIKADLVTQTIIIS